MLVDQLGNKFERKNYKRIVSIVPSQTELLYDLGLGERVVGITKFCIHPNDWFTSKTRVGGTKTVDVDKVAQLKPDLIIGNKEENDKENIESLAKLAPVWMSDIFTLDDSLNMITELGNLLSVERNANDLIHQIKKEFSSINRLENPKTCLYLIWRKPYMAVGNQTFIHNMLTGQLGFENILKEQSRYPSIELEEFSTQPDFILLSSEPYPFKEKHFDEIKKMFPESKVLLVDGEYFSWYGSRLLGAPNYFKKLILEILD